MIFYDKGCFFSNWITIHMFESYQRLGVSFTDTHFESDYSEKVKDVLTLLREKDLVQFEWVCYLFSIFIWKVSHLSRHHVHCLQFVLDGFLSSFNKDFRSSLFSVCTSCICHRQDHDILWLVTENAQMTALLVEHYRLISHRHSSKLPGKCEHALRMCRLRRLSIRRKLKSFYLFYTILLLLQVVRSVIYQH